MSSPSPSPIKRSIPERLKVIAVSLLLGVTAGCATQPVPEVAVNTAPKPPIAAKKPYSVPSPNGARSDDYYWLRDDTRQSQEMLSYLNAENAYRDAVLGHTAALQEKLYSEMTGRLQPDDSTVPVYDHGYWYYQRYEAGKEYPVYARRKGRRDAPEQVLLDGNALSQGQSYFQIGDSEASPNGKLLAYSEDTVGRRQYTLKVKNLDTGEVLQDTVVNVEPDIVWANDNKTVLYVEKDPVTLLSVRVLKHKLGTRASSDELVYEEKDHSYYMQIGRAKSDKYLFISLHSTLQSEWRYADASDAKLKFKPVLPREANHDYEVENIGNDFIIRTNWNAPNFRIVRAPVARSADKKTWKDVIPARRDAFVQTFAVYRDYLAVNERSDGLLKLRVRPWKAGNSDRQDLLLETAEPSYNMSLVETPGLTSADGAQKLRYVYTSLTTPRTTFDFDLKTDRNEQLKQEQVLGNFDSANYTTEFLRAPARDGTLVPVSIVYRKGTPLDGTAPLYQYGYGSYGISSDPIFRSTWLSLLDRGFVVAIAHVRGGQELGRAWYENGKLLKKKNTFTDFVDVTRFLVERKYGARDKVFAEGRSAGGLLMGAVANIAPQDYLGIIAGVPFVDVVTTMLDESIPLTTNEFDEWGNPKQKESYDYMLSYSPYDNVAAKNYPAMFVHTGLWDSQVQYYEPAKWVAKLRALKTDKNPLIFSVDMAAGHGGKSGRFQKYHDTAMEYAFVLDQLGIQQ